MSNSGTFMHDRRGSLRMSDGYRVLVVIDDFGGSRAADLDRVPRPARQRKNEIKDTYAWPVTSHRIRMIGRGMPISHSSIERIKTSQETLGR